MKHFKNKLTAELEKNEDALKQIVYPANQDIYNNDILMTEIDPADISSLKKPNEDDKDDLNDVASGGLLDNELDIPGAELDDEQEAIGSEDEENNYYSLGLDNHNELKENTE